jgi:flagellar motor switch protein FliM
LLLVRQESETPQSRLLRSVHETFARTLGMSLSTFLQAEIGAQLDQTSTVSATEFQSGLTAPGCFISFQLDPCPERAILSFDGLSVFSMLELLLGGSGSGHPEPRILTEIEWSLLEEVVRVLVRSLGEAWKTFHIVEFKVQSLESDPALLTLSDSGGQLLRLTFALTFGELAGSFQIAVPQTFFEAKQPVEESVAPEPNPADFKRQLALLAEAVVDVEVMLDGPTMLFQELASVSPGQVIRFDYPLQKSVRAVVNGAVSIPCLIVSAGRKRAFQVEDLP